MATKKVKRLFVFSDMLLTKKELEEIEVSPGDKLHEVSVVHTFKAKFDKETGNFIFPEVK